MIIQTNANCQVSLQSLDNLLTHNERIKILNFSFSAELKAKFNELRKYIIIYIRNKYLGDLTKYPNSFPHLALAKRMNVSFGDLRFIFLLYISSFRPFLLSG